jgi:NAD(P)H dehydrogenase (quinone)
MKVAVTAASGNLGRAIVNSLIPEIGVEKLIGFARTVEKANDLGIEVSKGDYNSKNDFLSALNGVDVLLLVSGMDHPDKRIQQHRNIIEAAKEAGVRKIVYTSIVGKPGDSLFDAIVNSNRQTEQDIQSSGIEWSIGRNGLYIEPDLEYIDNYKKAGSISNCAGSGLCSYVSRDELANAYANMIRNDSCNSRIFNLCGDAISQEQLAAYLNLYFKTELAFRDMPVDSYLNFQEETNGPFLGPIIAGIYTKIRNGEFNVESHYEEACGRKHIGWDEYFSV